MATKRRLTMNGSQALAVTLDEPFDTVAFLHEAAKLAHPIDWRIVEAEEMACPSVFAKRFCVECDGRVHIGERVFITTDRSERLASFRHRVVHYDCHPAVVDGKIEEIRRQWMSHQESCP
jgi:hypothetical protein